MHGLRIRITNWVHSRRRVVNMLIGIGAVVLYEAAGVYYRPFINARGINDFHIADTLGNSLGAVANIFVFMSIFGRERAQDIFLIRTVTLALLVYELAHPLLGKPIDAWDMLATVVAGLSCEGLYRLLYRP